MSLDTTKLINVLNYNMNPVAIKTHVKEYICSPAESEDSPSIKPLSISEIESLNSDTNAFKIGTLRFPEDIEAQMYEEILRIVEWKDILTNKQIKEIILHPSVDGLRKIIEIRNVSLFERVRGIFFSLKNSNQYDISNRVEAIILRRYKELCNQQVKTSIELTSKDTTTAIPNEEVNALKEQNQAMQSQMEAMQKMMEQMMAMQSNKQQNVELKEEETKVEDTQVKKAGKPANSNKK